ncbi:MAG: septum formation protein [Thermoproteota archaeon]|jgi:septum formation protein
MKLILASKSPYRVELLERLNIPFEQIASNFNENSIKSTNLSPIQLAQRLAFEKAKSVATIVKNTDNEFIIIGGDQLVSFDNSILGKPYTKEKAIEQLQQMSGKTHELITSISLIANTQGRKEEIIFTNITKLQMRDFSFDQLKQYVELDCPIDCAGSYKLEQHGISLFSSIETTDQSAIMGIPLIQLTTELCKLGLSLFS